MLPVYMVFRGRRGPAGVKPAPAARVNAPAAAHKRPQCRGLIEAGAGCACDRPVSLSSAASVPRPH